MKHGPDSKCAHCAAVRAYAEANVKQVRDCRVCQGWGWTIGCPGCGRIWGKLWPAGRK